MPIFNTPLKSIDKAETLRYAGLRDKRSFSDELVQKACNEALLLATPKASWNIYKYDASSGTVFAAPPYKLSGENITSHLENSTEVAVIAVTIGKDLEDSLTGIFNSGQYTHGLLLDAAGTAAVEDAADTVSNLIAEQAKRNGLSAVSRFSPGYGDWDIKDQQKILQLAGGETINITVTETSMLVPRKSITAIIGLQPAPDLPQGNCKKTDCISCTLKNCLARKEHSQ